MKNYGSILVLLSAVFYSFGGLFFKLATWNSLAISSARSLIGFVIITVFLLIIKHKFVFNKWVLLAALVNTCTSILYSLANKMTTAGNTIVLQFTMPVYVIIITSLIKKKMPSKLEISTCLCVLLGIIVFFVDSLSAGNMLGNVLALVSGITYSLVFIFNGQKESDSLSAFQLSLLITGLVCLPELLKTDVVGSSKECILAVLGLGILQQGVGHILLSIGINKTSAVTASLLSGLEPILNPILVAVFYGELLTPLSLIGAVIVLIAIMSYNVIGSKTKEATS